MNKTVNINLGGIFFHIDEDAFQKLSRYFEAIKKSLNNTTGRDEIIKDIEIRVSELFNEKQKSEKHVVTLKEVDEVIAVMGQPEDYRMEGDDQVPNNDFLNDSPKTKLKKLYRDRENGMIGGVLAGLGHYFGIDKVWLRLFLLALLFLAGSGFIAYIILWIVIPEAKTTSEKLEMTGEPVNISSIEKKVREEFENVSDKIKNVDYDKVGNQVKNGAEKVGNSLGDIILIILKAFSKVLGVLLIMSGFSIIIGLLIAAFTLGSPGVVQVPWSNFANSINYTDFPIWVFGLIMFFAVGIPFFALALLGIKLLAPNGRTIGAVGKYTLVAVWIISVILAISISVKQAVAFGHEGKVTNKFALNLNQNDTLGLKFKFNSYFAKDINTQTDFNITQDSTGNSIIFSNDVEIEILKTDEAKPFVQIEKISRGASIFEAKKIAEQIKYAYKFENNTLTFDNYLITDMKNKFHHQNIRIYLYIPKNLFLKIDPSVYDYDRSNSEWFFLQREDKTLLFQATDSKLKCLNCQMDSSDIDENDQNQSTIIINGDTLLSSKDHDTLEVKKTNLKELKIDKNGVIIKTN